MLLHVLYLIGITAEAMTGALAAGRRRMDTFGVSIIATATALGGGSVRDILLGHYPLGWVQHPEYVIIVAVAAVLHEQSTQACADVMGAAIREHTQDWHMMQKVFVKDLDLERLERARERHLTETQTKEIGGES